MSLLNDALKAAEQRQDKPAPSPYTGQSTAAPARRGGTGKVVAGIGAIAILAAGAYFYLAPATPPATPVAHQAEQDSPARGTADAEPAAAPTEAAPAQTPSSSEPAAQTPAGELEAVEVTEPEADLDQGAADIVMLSSQEAEPEPTPERAEVSAPLTPEPEQSSTLGATAAPGVAEPEPVQRGPQPPTRTTTTATRARTEAEPQAAPPTVQANDEPAAQQPTANADIKQTRQTPAQRDLASSRDIHTLVSNGDLAAAENKLTALTDAQTAPQSRYAFARGVLARGDVDRALAWVPEDLAARYPDLRLIRARAILAGGDLDQAVATLQSAVPAVADNVEYRVTLATLLQQQGQSGRAANHWAELIAWDNGQAPWWVGLAIALEGRGDVPAARRAYQQAAALPGLAPSLSDYVRQRLQTLGAG